MRKFGFTNFRRFRFERLEPEQPADGKYYFLAANKMLKWAINNFPDPDVVIKGASDGSALLGKRGIYFMTPNYPAKFGASGHATIYNGSGCPGGSEHCYFNNAVADGGVYRVYLWILK